MRRTNLEEVFFPIREQAIYLQGHNKPLDDFVAIEGEFDNQKKVFSVVTKNYKLITNEGAYLLILEILEKHYKPKGSTNFSVFNILYPSTRSFVHIDIIHEAFKLNIGKKEIFLPFFRITNSYNKTKRFSIDVGFVRKLCDNGMIFEKALVQLSFAHNRIDLTESKIIEALNQDRFIKYREEFEDKIKSIQNFQIKKHYFIPLIAKALNLNFSTIGKTQKDIRHIKEARSEFINEIIPLASKYYKEFSSTGYAVFNIITDYASNVLPEHGIRYNQINSNQVKAGNWLNSFQAEIRSPKFDITQYLEDYKDFMIYSFN